MLRPKADRRKDWEDRAMVGYFIGYSKHKVGYRILLRDKVITSVHVLFHEAISEQSADYFQEQDEATVNTDPKERRVDEFNWLIGRYHMDEGLLYKTTRVVVRRGLIVGYRSLITPGSSRLKKRLPFTIADMQATIEEFSRRQRKTTVRQDDDDNGGVSTVATDSTRLTADPATSSGNMSFPRAESENSGKRVRTPRVLTNDDNINSCKCVFQLREDCFRPYRDFNSFTE